MNHDPGCAPTTPLSDAASWFPENPAPLIGVVLVVIGLLLLGVVARAAILQAIFMAGYAAGMVAPQTLCVAFVIGFPFALIYWGNHKED